MGESLPVEVLDDVAAAVLAQSASLRGIAGEAFDRRHQRLVVLRREGDAAVGGAHELGGVALEAEQDRLGHGGVLEQLGRQDRREDRTALEMHETGVGGGEDGG